MRPLRTLLVDDEPQARRGLRKLLAADDEFAVVGECGSGREAIASIRADPPDVLFLDIQMPAGGGFEVVAALDGPDPPIVVFATAHDEHTLRAFEVNALDYLLKPFSDARFYETLERVKRRHRDRSATELRRELRALQRSLRGASLGESPPPTYRQRFAIRSREAIDYVDVDEVDWIAAQADYVRLHAGDRRLLMRASLGQLAAELDPQTFVRIHRSTLVNRSRVVRLVQRARGQAIVELVDGTCLRVSRNRRAAVERALEGVSPG